MIEQTRKSPTVRVSVASKPWDQDQLYRPTKTVNAIVDTGFTGGLALPQKIIDELELYYLGTSSSTFANGTVSQTRRYHGFVEVGLIAKECVVSECPTVLLGMGFLHDLKVTIQNGIAHIDGAFVDLNKRVS